MDAIKVFFAGCSQSRWLQGAEPYIVQAARHPGCDQPARRCQRGTRLTCGGGSRRRRRTRGGWGAHTWTWPWPWPWQPCACGAGSRRMRCSRGAPGARRRPLWGPAEGRSGGFERRVGASPRPQQWPHAHAALHDGMLVTSRSTHHADQGALELAEVLGRCLRSGPHNHALAGRGPGHLHWCCQRRADGGLEDKHGAKLSQTWTFVRL